MEAESRSASSGDRPTPKLANVIGTLIAMLTLTLPLVVVAHYSSADSPAPLLLRERRDE
jgi:hypothetical protein